MTDAQPVDDGRDMSQDAPPVDAAPKADPHLVDEDPEEHLGQEITDPWADGGTTWPSVESQVEDEKDYTEEESA